MKTKAFFTIAALLFFSGCSAKSPSIYQVTSLPTNKPSVITMDAKQRSILNMPYKSGKGNNEFILSRFCAEPSPDVFTALASSFSLDSGLSADVASQTGELALKIASTVAENAATIERTQTINILRESMYRTCERYMSGAIQWQELVVQAARDQRTIVSVLGIEQLTGAARAQSIALTTLAKAASIGADPSTIKLLAEAKQSADNLTEQSNEKQERAEGLEPATMNCEALRPLETIEGSDEEKAKITAKKEACETATVAQEKSDEATAYYNTIKKAVDQANSVTAEASGALQTALQNPAQINEQIAQKVVDIIKEHNQFDEITMTCVALLRSSETAFQQSVEAIPDKAYGFSVLEKKKLVEKRASFQQECINLLTTLAKQRYAELPIPN